MPPGATFHFMERSPDEREGHSAPLARCGPEPAPICAMIILRLAMEVPYVDQSLT